MLASVPGGLRDAVSVDDGQAGNPSRPMLRARITDDLSCVAQGRAGAGHEDCF